MKKTVLIFEGPDASGKTTLMDYVSTRLWTRSFVRPLNLHFGAPDIDHWGHVCLGHCRAWQHLEEPAILVDRFHWSELVYGKILRNVSEYERDVTLYRTVLHELREFDTTVVFVLPTYQVAVERYKKKMHDGEYDASTYTALYSRYMQVYSQHKEELPTIYCSKFDTEPQIDQMAEYIISYICAQRCKIKEIQDV